MVSRFRVFEVLGFRFKVSGFGFHGSGFSRFSRVVIFGVRCCWVFAFGVRGFHGLAFAVRGFLVRGFGFGVSLSGF